MKRTTGAMALNDKKPTDEIDQGCVKCIPKEPGLNKENVSLSSSSDDETEQAISMNINKKSNSSAYKGNGTFIST